MESQSQGRSALKIPVRLPVSRPQKENPMTDCVKLGMWVVRSRHKCYLRGVSFPSAYIVNTSFAYLFSLANYNKGKYPEFCISCSKETWWYMGRGALKSYPWMCNSVVVNAHLYKYLICIFA